MVKLFCLEIVVKSKDKGRCRIYVNQREVELLVDRKGVPCIYQISKEFAIKNRNQLILWEMGIAENRLVGRKSLLGGCHNRRHPNDRSQLFKSSSTKVIGWSSKIPGDQRKCCGDDSEPGREVEGCPRAWHFVTLDYELGMKSHGRNYKQSKDTARDDEVLRTPW
jgi:hypothetical protein